MPVRVVDASALGALAFGERKAEKVAIKLEDSRLVAPALLWFEFASICLKKIKAHPSQKLAIVSAFNLAHKLAIEIIDMDHAEVIALADEAGLTTYDASYVWLARQLDAELITLDEKMKKVLDR